MTSQQTARVLLAAFPVLAEPSCAHEISTRHSRAQRGA